MEGGTIQYMVKRGMDMPEYSAKTDSRNDYNLVLSVTVNGKILYASTNCDELLGYERDELIGLPIKNIIHSEDVFMLESSFFNLHNDDHCSFRVKTKKGIYIWFESNILAINTEARKTKEVFLKMKLLQHDEEGLGTPPTDLEPIQNTRIPQASYLNALRSNGFELVEVAPFPIIISKLGKIVYLNNSAINLLEITSIDDLIGSPMLRFIDEEFHHIVLKRTELLQHGHLVGIIEQKWLTATGKTLDVEVKSIPVVCDQDQFEYTVIHDISSRKTFEEIIHTSRERYQRIVQNSIDTIAVIYDNNWVFINDSGVRMFGGNSFSEIIGRNIYTFLDRDYHEKIKDFIDTVIHDKKEVNIRKQSWRTLNGSEIFSELIGIPTTYFGEPAVQVIIRDISDRLNAEELMIKSEKLSIAGQLAAGIAHEIRNPLTAIKGFLQLLHIDVNDKQQYFDIILSELNRIELILSELLLLAKPTAVKYSEIDVKTILRDVVTLLDTQAILNNIQINLEVIEESTIIKCDPNQIKQVFINMIKNAIDAMKNGGEINIKLSESASHIKFTIKDNGCGIPSSIIDRIGEPFYTTKEKGTGLGLMVSYNIIENHGGVIEVDSIENVGTTFEITLPRICYN